VEGAGGGGRGGVGQCKGVQGMSELAVRALGVSLRFLPVANPERNESDLRYIAIVSLAQLVITISLGDCFSIDNSFSMISTSKHRFIETQRRLI
jgi:hypothetical protein